MYNETTGDEKQGIPPKTPFAQFDPSWVCPMCGNPKENFIEVAG